MLVLSRNIGKAVRIDENITITVVGIADNKVKFCIITPKNILVRRYEIYNRIQHNTTPPYNSKLTKSQATAEKSKPPTIQYKVSLKTTQE